MESTHTRVTAPASGRAGEVPAPAGRAAIESIASGPDLPHPMRGVLHVLHHHGGGTESHVRELIDASRDRWRHYLAIAVGARWQVEAHRRDGSLATFEFVREAHETMGDFLAGICVTFGIALIHLHNISGCHEELQEALVGGSIPFGYTLHDLNFACPTITFLNALERYCGGVTDTATCNLCLGAQRDFAHIEIESWRARHARLAADASFLIAPSHWAAHMFARYFPGCDATLISHGTRAGRSRRSTGARLGVVMPDDGIPVVAVLGAIGPDKGARRIERLTALIRAHGTALRVVVIGYLDIQHGPWQADDARLTVHGRYKPGDLPDLLAHYRAALVLYPSVGPETFSYTLSEAWRAGMPVLVPPIGALGERVSAARAGWVMTHEEWSDDERMLERIVALTAGDAADERRAMATAARAVRHDDIVTMADATLALYDAAADRRAGTIPGRPFSAQRIRDAQGNVSPRLPSAGNVLAEAAASTPGATAVMPHNCATARPSSTTVWHHIARAALAIRRTSSGRILYRLVPSALIESLKTRLGD